MLTRRLLIGGGVPVVAWSARADSTMVELRDHAPFGLRWGESTDQVAAKGITLSRVSRHTEYEMTYAAIGLTETLIDTFAVWLYFGLGRLYRIVAQSKDQGPDPYGHFGTLRYNELLTLLSTRYGTGRETDYRSDGYTRHPERYVYYLSQNRAIRTTDFLAEGMAIQLALRAETSDFTHWVLTYENIQEAAAFANGKAAKEGAVL